MPDRRIDAIGKSDATRWNSTQLPKGSPNQVKILSGSLAQTTPGMVIHAMVQKEGNGAFKIVLNGESFLIKGLPDSLAGKKVAFIVQVPMNQANGKPELFWIGTTKSGIENKQTKHVHVISTLPSGVKEGHFKLAAGDTIPAFVQQRLSNGHIQLNIQGVNVETPAPNHVQKGDVLMLKMNKPPADFQLLSVHKNVADKALATLKANLAASNTPMAKNITSIRHLLPNLPNLPNSANLPMTQSAPINVLPLLESSLKANEVSSTQPLDGRRLQQMIHNAGTGLESKLLQLSKNPVLSPSIQQDLKFIMLQLANHQAGTAQQTELIKTLTELAQQSVSRIETSQALNLLAHIQGEPIRVELPMLVNQQVINVQLSMQQQTAYDPDDAQKEDSSEQSYNILFSLELSQLGNIRVDANISDTAVHARIYNDNKDSSLFILDNIQRLETRLRQLGFEEIYLIASQQQPTVEKQQQFNQMDQMLPASLHLLDIRI